jgi:hypothetical protein
MLSKIMKEPLVHFLLIGASLFGLYAWSNPGAMQSDKRIVVDQGQIDNLTERFRRVWQREPTDKEMQSLIEDFVIEEIYYREALAMGIDKNDPVIRRRLRQKMELYTDNLATTLTPNEEQLQTYLQHHSDKFRTDSRYTFKQVYINTDRPEQKLDQALAITEAALQSGKSVQGDPSLLPTKLTDVEAHSVDRIFGRGFASQLDNLKLNKWSGPLHSGVGIHFIHMEAYQPGELPELVTIRDKVEREWRFDQAQKVDKSLRKKLLASYEVIVKPDQRKQ